MSAERPYGAASDLFRGPHSLRWKSERAALWLTLLFAPLTVAIVGIILRQQLSVTDIVFLMILAMVYVTIARGRLLGTSIRVHENQLPEVFAVAQRCARMLGVSVPLVFVRDDLFVPITALGLGPPYALIISSQWLPHLDEVELEFLIGRELGHIAANHTRNMSLFSATGKENPLIAIVFGAWLRRTEYTADRVGMLCCRSLETATRAIFATSFHTVKGRIDPQVFAEQRRELVADSSLRMGEWLAQEPYATNRLEQLRQFASSVSYAYWCDVLDQHAQAKATGELTLASEGSVETRRAGLFVRSFAFIVDLMIVSAILNSGRVIFGQQAAQMAADPDVHQLVISLAPLGRNLGEAVLPISTFFAVLLYSAILVGLTGHTFGMMILGMQVTRSDNQRVGFMRALWRYVLALLCAITVVPLAIGLLTGRFIHDRLSGTRVIRTAAV